MGMVKKKSSHKHISTNSTHIMLKKGIVVYALMVFVLFILISVAWYTVHQFVESRTHINRRNQIVRIYESLSLGDNYRGVTSNIFGDKRVYDWDKGRSYSSSVEYTHNDTPANTASDLKKKLEAAGFVPAGTAYDGSTSPQYHYKNGAGNYVRVTVTSKYVQDAMMYGDAVANEPVYTHKDDAPTYVTIKVNLDDNNE